ncbi:MAG: hypothetical protein PHD66_06900 [Eubacteriales bacterium]|nr:hypothetical protein [Eubacteriales bacterium]
MNMNEQEMIINAVAVLIGDYSRERKKAAKLILKMLLPGEVYKDLMNDEQLKPVVKALK